MNYSFFLLLSILIAITFVVATASSTTWRIEQYFSINDYGSYPTVNAVQAAVKRTAEGYFSTGGACATSVSVEVKEYFQVENFDDDDGYIYLATSLCGVSRPLPPDKTPRPTLSPSRRPSFRPSSQPSQQPSRQPSSQPSRSPVGPSSQPTMQPSRRPTSQPTLNPMNRPSSQPSQQPSRLPSSQPSRRPSSQPSRSPVRLLSPPTSQPTMQPSRRPTSQPTLNPINPSSRPSRQPTRQPSSQPSVQPSRQPTSQPTAVSHIQVVYDISLSDLDKSVCFKVNALCAQGSKFLEIGDYKAFMTELSPTSAPTQAFSVELSQTISGIAFFNPKKQDDYEDLLKKTIIDVMARKAIVVAYDNIYFVSFEVISTTGRRRLIGTDTTIEVVYVVTSGATSQQMINAVNATTFTSTMQQIATANDIVAFSDAQSQPVVAKPISSDPTPPPKDTTSSKSTSSDALTGAIIGCLIGGIAIGVAATCFHFYKKNQGATPSQDSNSDFKKVVPVGTAGN